MIEPIIPDWWPARQLQRHPLREVVACGRRLNPPLFGHVVNFPRLEIPLHGIYRNQIEDKGEIVRIELSAGMALFAAANCWNLPEWRPGLELLGLSFGRTQINISLVSARSKNYPQLASQKLSLPRPIAGPVPHLLNALEELHADGGKNTALADVSRALLGCVETLMREPISRPGGRAQTLLEEVRVFLQGHYQYEITRDSVAAHFNITPNHLSRLFQTHGHITFSGYLTQVRTDRAKHLLCNYNLKLDDIAARCGYHDTPYFCHVFKKLTKLTPIEYRLKMRQKNPAAGR
jgi:AraC-like DNA-binding protein